MSKNRDGKGRFAKGKGTPPGLSREEQRHLQAEEIVGRMTLGSKSFRRQVKRVELDLARAEEAAASEGKK